MTGEGRPYPYVSVTFILEEQASTVLAYVDTGFDGDLSVPADQIPPEARAVDFQEWRTAFESRHEAPVYAGVVHLNDLPTVPAVIAALGTEPILGRGLIDRYRVLFDRGERVTIEA